MFFGDTAQQVYKSTLGGKKPVSMEDIKNLTELNEISLSGNKRLYPSVAKVAQYLNADENIVNNCTKIGGNKPILKHFFSESEELDWIVEQINDRQLEDVGILLPENTSRNEKLNGVFDTFNYLQSKGLKLGVKYKILHFVKKRNYLGGFVIGDSGLVVSSFCASNHTIESSYD